MGALLKKQYGQHFLRDTGILHRIVDLIQPESDDLMLEVGAGDGALSVRLASRVLRLLAIEIDVRLIPLLTEALSPFPNTEVVGADILNLDLPLLVSPHLRPGVRLRFVGNLPYNIGTAIIEKLLSLPLPLTDLTFMLQLETAERICAAPGSKEYGFFSVYCQHYCEVLMGFKVSPACFVPRPKVVSAMLCLRPRNCTHERDLENDFALITKAAFAHRRKTLANSLRHNDRLAPVTDELLARAGIDGMRRAEDLSVPEYEKLVHIYQELRAAGK